MNAGVANGDVVSDELWQGDALSTWNGRCILLVHAGSTPGEATVTATAGDLAPSPCLIRVAQRTGESLSLA